MNWFMSVAAGAALGYFLIQFLTRKGRVDGTEEGGAVTVGRLHRSKTDRKIAGVCGGIAEYLNTDPTVVRLVTVLLMLGFGSGLLAYIVCAIVMPEE